MGNSGVDGRLGEVLQDAPVVVRCIRATSILHHARQLEGTAEGLADPPHALTIARGHVDQPKVVEHVLGSHRGGAHPVEGQLMVTGQILAQHVHEFDHGGVLGSRVDAVREGRVGRRGEDVRLAGQPHDVGSVAAAGALDVVRVDGAPVDHAERVVDE